MTRRADINGYDNPIRSEELIHWFCSVSMVASWGLDLPRAAVAPGSTATLVSTRLVLEDLTRSRSSKCQRQGARR